jgi:hypothetical protein
MRPAGSPFFAQEKKSKVGGLLRMTGHALKRQMKSSGLYEPKGSSGI